VDHGRAIQSPAGAEYDVIVEVAWDDQPLGAGVVRGTIDDHGWKACEDVYEIFSKDPDGRIVGIPGRRFHSRRGDNPKVTRPGIEGGPNVTKRRSVAVAPTERSAAERPPVTVHCNECNETLEAVRATVTNAKRLAIVAENALANGDVARARAALAALNELLTGSVRDREPANGVATLPRVRSLIER